MARLLDAIDGPGDLKKLDAKELQQLAQEIRQELISTVTISGGHLASNLGVVELTIALHRVFDSPRDKLVWDVGHQSYVHKLLTGRRDRFGTLRQLNGLSGFTDRSESPHDPFGSGHASTSVSAALGIATARDLKGEEFSVVAVIGDGALTGGMAFEALNHAGHMRTNFIVILNDNQMSISPTVGAITGILNRLWLDERLEKAESRAERILSGSVIGRRVLQLGREMKRGFKSLTLPPAKIWEELGFTYMGPFDGHDIPKLEASLVQARIHQRDKPIFFHVITTKGKGYPPAEADAVRYHGVANNMCTQLMAPTFSEIFADTLHQIMADDPRVVVITAAMAEGNCLGTIARDFPNRFFDVGICEEHATTFAAGLATQGVRPVIAIYSTFMQRAIDQLIHDVCLQDLPVVFAMDRAGIVGDDGKTHQGLFDLSYLTMVPNLIVSAPKDGNELRQLLYTAIRADHPMAVRYPRTQTAISCPRGTLEELPIGRGEILRDGKDITILTVGPMALPALDAARALSELGIEAAVVNARYIKPLDSELILGLCRASGRVVTVEENVLAGGFGSAVIQLLHSAGLDNTRARCIGITDQYVEHGPQHILRSKFGLDAPGIVRTVIDNFPELRSSVGERPSAAVS